MSRIASPTTEAGTEFAREATNVTVSRLRNGYLPPYSPDFDPSLYSDLRLVIIFFEFTKK
jgi:hypothetical protein